MDITEIQDMWEKDSQIDIDKLIENLMLVQNLHSKYYKFFVDESKLLRKYEHILDREISIKRDYYSCKLSGPELKNLGLKPYHLSLGSYDITPKVNADIKIIKIKKILGDQKDKVDFLESVIKMIHKRNTTIESIMKHYRFMQGANF